MNIYLYIYLITVSAGRVLDSGQSKGCKDYTGEGPSALGTKNLLLSYPANYQLHARSSLEARHTMPTR